MPTFIFGMAIFTLMALFVLIFYSYKKLGKERVIKTLFKEFKRKIWMTCCLGGVFFGFFFLFIWIGTTFVQEEWKKNPLPLFQASLLSLVYDGLLVFACFSLMIYFIRMLIKYFYLTRGKDF